MISTSATSTNHCSYHWPSIHRLCAVPDERARLFFLIYILNCSAGNKSRVSGKLFAKWKKQKKQGTCRGKCFPVLAELAVGKSSTHKVSLSRTFSLIRIPGRGAAGSRAHLLEIFRYFTVFFFLLAASGASSTCGHPFSCGTARSRAPCVSCSWGWQHLGNSNHRLPPSLPLFSLSAGLLLSYSFWIRTKPCHWCPSLDIKAVGPPTDVVCCWTIDLEMSTS